MRPNPHIFVSLLVLAVILPSTLWAAGQGRITGTVVDPDGKPVPGVTVTVTSPEITTFNEVRTTDKRGVFRVSFSRGYAAYKYRFEKDGFQPAEADQKWTRAGAQRHSFTIHPADPNTAIAEGAVSSSNEAILAFNAGVDAFKTKNYPLAENKFNEALTADPNLHQALAALSEIYLEQNQPQKAVDAAEKAMAMGSADESVLKWRWEAYRKLGNKEKVAEALADLEAAGQRTEEAKRIYNAGVKLNEAGDAAGAYGKFREALEVDPNLRVALVAVAGIGLKAGHHAEAAAAAEKILQLDPGHEQAMRVRVDAYTALGEEDKVVDALVDLAVIDQAFAIDNLYRRAIKVYNAGNIPAAKRALGRALEAHPAHPQSHYYLGLCYAGEGDNANAKKHLQRFIELAPDDPEVGTAREMLSYVSG